MNTRKFLIPALCGLALGLVACGGDSPAAAEEPVSDPFGGGAPASSASIITSGTTILSSATQLPAQTVLLSPTANPAATVPLYQSWLAGHYVTLDAESVYYGEIANQFGHVFKDPQYLPAARIVWSTAQGGGMRPSASLMNPRIPK